MTQRNVFFTEPKKPAKRRPKRVAERIRIEVSLILQRSISDPRLQGVSIVGVDVSDDLKLAKVLYGCIDEAADDAAAGFASAGGFIRSSLASLLELRYVPQLVFRRDETLSRQGEIEKLLREITDDKE